MNNLVRYFQCTPFQSGPGVRQLRSELTHLLVALMFLSESSDRLREHHGEVRLWASDHSVLYGPEGTDYDGVLLPLAQTLNTKLDLRVPLHKADWSWACPRVEGEGMVNLRAARSALQEPDVVSKV